MGDCWFYNCRENVAHHRCGAHGYFLGYGKKFCVRFHDMTRPLLSHAGKAWVDRVRTGLQDHLQSHTSESTACKKVKEVGFASHPKVYVDAGLHDLPPEDLILIVATPGRSLLTRESLRQVVAVLKSYSKRDILNALGRLALTPERISIRAAKAILKDLGVL